MGMRIPTNSKTESHPHAWVDRPGQITERQLEVLTYLRRYWQTFRSAPSVREICIAFGTTSPQGMQRHLVTLEKRGATVPLLSSTGFSRGYELTDLGRELTNEQDLSPLPLPTVRRPRGGLRKTVRA